ncbi:MAG: DUF192 domain-containing protein [Vicinamibacterales bacterium]
MSGPRSKRMFLTPLLGRPDVLHVLRNETRGNVLARNIEAALDSRTRRRGLLGRDGLPAGTALIIAPCNAIHTFFMRFPIDVVFVARDGTVIGASENVRPWRMRAALRAFATIELASGAIRAAGVRPGDRLLVAPEAEPLEVLP